MPSIDYKFLLSLKDNFHNYKTFVETGTHKGITIFEMEKYFDELYTIEINEILYNNVKNKYKGNKINFILGDSSYVLNDLSNKIYNNAIFFLDGHWSSGDTGRGYKDCPLLEEIQCINNNFKNNAIIIIDDHRLFGKGPKNKQLPEDWEDISDKKIIEIVFNRITHLYFLPSERDLQDRMVIHIKKL